METVVSQMPLLEARNLSYGVPGGRVLQRNLGFRLTPGEVLLISGPNGAGKSTLLKLLLGREAALEGTLDCRVDRRRVSYLPQLENTAVHLPFTLGDVLRAATDGRDPEEVVAIYPGLLEPWQLGLAWNAASGGERKRTMLLRTLLEDPSLLVLDEPLNHLDPPSRLAVIRAVATFLVRAREGLPRAAVVVSHQGFADEAKSLITVNPLVLGRTDAMEAMAC